MSDALLGLAAGLATGALMTRGGLCFNRALRRAMFERSPAVLRAFAIAVAAQLLLLPLLITAGVDTLRNSAEAGGPRCCRSPSSAVGWSSARVWRSPADA